MKRFVLLLMTTLALVVQMALAAYAQDDDYSVDYGSDVDTVVINNIIIQMLSAQKNEQSSNSPTTSPLPHH